MSEATIDDLWLLGFIVGLAIVFALGFSSGQQR